MSAFHCNPYHFQYIYASLFHSDAASREFREWLQRLLAQEDEAVVKSSDFGGQLLEVVNLWDAANAYSVHCRYRGEEASERHFTPEHGQTGCPPRPHSNDLTLPAIMMALDCVASNSSAGDTKTVHATAWRILDKIRNYIGCKMARGTEAYQCANTWDYLPANIKADAISR